MRTEFLIKSKGITLIALVVTIIVLLILAGVAINLAIGNNGIFTRAQDATIRHENASVYEQLQFIIADYQMNDVENNTSTDILSKLIADGYVNEDHTLNVEPLMGRSMNTGNGNLEQGDVYVIEQSQKTASSIISDSNNSIGYYLIYYNEDKTEINLGLAFENMEHIEAPTTSGLKLKIRPSYYESPSSSFNSNYSINTLNTLSTSILPLSTFVESRNIAILCFLTYADSLNVNWGDGTVENLSTLDIDDIENYGEIGHAFFQTLTELLDYYNLNGYKIFLEAHTYQDSKEYSVEINGDIKVILPFTGHSLLEIENWGQSEYDRILLSGSEHLTQIASPNETNFKNITSFADSFYNCSSLQYIPEDFFSNAPNVTSFYFCFNGCINLAGTAPDVWTNIMKLQFYKNYTLGDLYNLYVPDESTSEEDAEKAFQEFYNTLKSDGLSDEEISNLFEEATYKLLYGLSGCYGYCEKLDNYNQIPEPCKLKERGS